MDSVSHSSQRTHIRVLILALILLSAAGGCDFPADPPLKSTDIVIPPRDPYVPIDSSRVLLPLQSGNQWTYAVFTSEGAPVQNPTYAVAGRQVMDGRVFFEVSYKFEKGGPGPGGSILAFPPLLQNTSEGLRFLDPGGNKTEFLLPYPAPKGQATHDPSGDYTVKVTAKDTSVVNLNGTVAYQCYRYDVIPLNQTRPKYTFYVIPGAALLRVDTEGYVFYTVSWSFKL